MTGPSGAWSVRLETRNDHLAYEPQWARLGDAVVSISFDFWMCRR